MTNDDDRDTAKRRASAVDAELSEARGERSALALRAQWEHVGYLRQIRLQEQSRTRWRPIILFVACTVPLIILLCLGYGLFTMKIITMVVSAPVQVALISGSLLIFIVIYSFAIRGLFSMPTDTGKVDELLRRINLDSKGE